MKRNLKSLLKSSFHTGSTTSNPCPKWARVALLYSFWALFVSCGSKKETAAKDPNDPKIARVYDRIIYASELPAHTRSDSAVLVAGYIDQAAGEEALLLKAKESQLVDMESIDAKTEQFRNALIALRYQQETLKQNLDTIVADTAIIRYFRQNEKVFHADQDIFSGYYAKLPQNTPRLQKIKTLMSSEKPNDFAELKSLILRYGTVYLLDKEDWNPVPSDIKKEITADKLSYLARSGTVMSIEKEDFVHLLHVTGYRAEGQPAPVGYAQADIKNVLLNKRKMHFLNQMREQLLQEAKTTHHIEIY